MNKKNRLEISVVLLSRNKKKSFLHKIVIDEKDLIWYKYQITEIID